MRQSTLQESEYVRKSLDAQTKFAFWLDTHLRRYCVASKYRSVHALSMYVVVLPEESFAMTQRMLADAKKVPRLMFAISQTEINSTLCPRCSVHDMHK